MGRSNITPIRPVAAGGCTKRFAALADDFSKIVRLPLTTSACVGTLTANPSYSHTMCASSAKARPPYERVIESDQVSKEKKERLREGYERANPAQLKREITRLQNELVKINSKKDKSKGEKNIVCVNTAKGKK